MLVLNERRRKRYVRGPTAERRDEENARGKGERVERCKRRILKIFRFREESIWRAILSIGSAPIFDDRIVRIETHSYNPYTNTTFGYSEIRISIQQQDLYTLPCESFLYIEEKFATRESAKEDTAKEGTKAKLVNNCVAFMFDEI
ncbi:hypothetical protein P5V15_015845 [Pogonomyrmex californicus]